MFPASAMQPNNRRKAPAAAKKASKIDEAQSKDIMGELFDELDKNDAEELAETNHNLAAHQQVVNEQGQVALSKHEEMQFKGAAAQPAPELNAIDELEGGSRPSSAAKVIPNVNPFAKKRKFGEHAQAAAPQTNGSAPAKMPAAAHGEADVSMKSEPVAEPKSAAAQSDVAMESVAEPKATETDTRLQKAAAKARTSTTEEDWRRLKQ